jgi:non-histone protein 10
LQIVSISVLQSIMPAIPSTLPPSVEEAYRRKCVQLKNRTNEVEEANDAARLRLARIKRQVEKMRVERAFLLEQLAKRTSANVEDSDGSPSPPPTPKDKPLRTKRGHRKSMMPDTDTKTSVGASFANTAGSPTSDTFSHPPESQSKQDHANGVSAHDDRIPASAFVLYCRDRRADVENKDKDGDGNMNVDEELAQLWKDLPENDREEYEARFEEMKSAEAKKTPVPEKKEDKPSEDKPAAVDEDVEMGDDTEDQDTQAGEKTEE